MTDLEREVLSAEVGLDLRQVGVARGVALRERGAGAGVRVVDQLADDIQFLSRHVSGEGDACRECGHSVTQDKPAQRKI